MSKMTARIVMKETAGEKKMREKSERAREGDPVRRSSARGGVDGELTASARNAHQTRYSLQRHMR